ncbi:hypothetical protein D9M69_705570 [compost metagenome]
MQGDRTAAAHVLAHRSQRPVVGLALVARAVGDFPHRIEPAIAFGAQQCIGLVRAVLRHQRGLAVVIELQGHARNEQLAGGGRAESEHRRAG